MLAGCCSGVNIQWMHRIPSKSFKTYIYIYIYKYTYYTGKHIVQTVTTTNVIFTHNSRTCINDLKHAHTMQTLNKRCSLSCGSNTIAWVDCNVSIWFRYTMRNMQCVLKVLTVRRWFHSLNSKILNASCPVDQISYSRSYSISTKQNENIRGNFLFSFTFAPQSWIWSIQLVFLCIVYDLHLMRESKASVLGCRFTIALFFFVNSSESPAWNQWRCLWSLWKMLTADKI